MSTMKLAFNILYILFAFKPEMTPLMTFDPLSLNTPYEARPKDSYKNILVEIDLIV